MCEETRKEVPLTPLFVSLFAPLYNKARDGHRGDGGGTPIMNFELTPTS